MDEFEELQRQRQALKDELNESFEAWDSKSGGSDSSVLGSHSANLGMVMDIPVRISMEVGSASISVKELLSLNQGAVIELDRIAGEPLDVIANGRLIAKGEVVVVNEQLGIRLTELVSNADRVQSLVSKEK